MKLSTTLILLNAFPDKKIKSLGNRLLIDISKEYKIIDYQINLFLQTYKNINIVIVGSFETKKLKKYIDKRPYSKHIKFIDHEITPQANIGLSILSAIGHMTSDRVILYSSNLLLDRNTLQRLNKCNSSFVVSIKDTVGHVGCSSYDNYILHCFYGIGDKIYDMVSLNKDGIDIVKKCLISYPNIEKLYLFEILNLCLTHDAKILMLHVNHKSIRSIESSDNLDSIKRFLNKSI